MNETTPTSIPVEEIKNWLGNAVALPNPNPQTPPNVTLIKSAQELNEYHDKYTPMSPVLAKFDFDHYIYVVVNENASGCSANISAQAANNLKTNQVAVTITVEEIGNCEPLYFFNNCYAIKRPNPTTTFSVQLEHTYK